MAIQRGSYGKCIRERNSHSKHRFEEDRKLFKSFLVMEGTGTSKSCEVSCTHIERWNAKVHTQAHRYRHAHAQIPIHILTTTRTYTLLPSLTHNQVQEHTILKLAGSYAYLVGRRIIPKALNHGLIALLKHFF